MVGAEYPDLIINYIDFPLTHAMKRVLNRGQGFVLAKFHCGTLDIGVGNMKREEGREEETGGG